MKKKYLVPETELVIISLERMIAVSDGVKVSGGSDFWDDVDD